MKSTCVICTYNLQQYIHVLLLNMINRLVLCHKNKTVKQLYNKRVRGAPKGGLRTQETRLATALIKFRNKERNVRLPT